MTQTTADKKSGEQEPQGTKKRTRRAPELENDFGVRLYKLRKSKGWTQQDMADRLDVNVLTVARWEHGETEPGMKQLTAIASVLGITFDFLMDFKMDYGVTQYSEKYKQEGFYWGEAIWDVAYDVLRLMPSVRPIRLLEIGCGEGQAAVFFARNGYDVSAFDIASAGLKKGKRLAAENRVYVHFFQANLLSYVPKEQFDIIYGHGVLEYIPVRQRKNFMKVVQEHTALNGLNVFDAFIQKNFIATAPDWEAGKEHFWRTGELSSYYGGDWRLERSGEVILDYDSAGIPHQHCMDIIVARRMM